MGSDGRFEVRETVGGRAGGRAGGRLRADAVRRSERERKTRSAATATAAARETDTIYLVIMRMGLWWAIRTEFGAEPGPATVPPVSPVAPGRLIMETNRINKR